MGLSRRGLLTLGLIGGGYALLQLRGAQILERITGLPELVPLDSPAGFRLLGGDAQSAGISDPFIGLQSGTEIVPEAIAQSDIENALFGASQTGKLPVAYFTDYNCPYCRVLGADLEALQAEMPDIINLIWHELPLLGPPSVLGARAALAAGLQGQYLAMHKRLNTGIIRITESFIDQIGTELSLDMDRLRADMSSAAIDQKLARSKGVADLFAVIGTPFLVVGTTAVSGRISPTRLRQLADLEMSEAGITAR